jgi:subtilisin family serine protease
MKNYLIDFVDNTSDDVISAYLSSNQCTVTHAYKNLNKVYHVTSETVPPLDNSIITSIIDDDESAITLLDIVKVKEPSYILPTRVETIENNAEKNWWKLYSISGLDLSNDNSNIDIYGSNTSIYILDSGIDTTHSEFNGQDISLVYSFTGDFNDNNGHGTSLASVMVGNTCGVTSSSIKVVKIFDENQSTRQSDFLHALDAILADMNTSTSKFSIINCSWAINKNAYIENKIKHLINAGALVVASAGNSGIPIEQVTPASMPEVITIGAYNSDFIPCDFSNYSNPSVVSLTPGQVNTGALDGWAPGEQIWVAVPAVKGGGFGFSAGTSLSAAIYSASLAYNISKEFYITEDLFLFRYYTPGTTAVNNGMFANRNVRSGLLDLSDSKYADSVNKICTFNPQPATVRPMRYKDETTIYIIHDVNTKTYRAIFSPTGVNSYEFITPLPDWITIPENDGLLLLNTINKTTVDASGIDRGTTKIKLYLEDGTEAIIILDTSLLGEYDAELLAEDDPVTLYRLQSMAEDCYQFTPGQQGGQYPQNNPCTLGNCAFVQVGYAFCYTYAKECVCSGT